MVVRFDSFPFAGRMYLDHVFVGGEGLTGVEGHFRPHGQCLLRLRSG